MTDKFILDGKVAVPCSDLMTWARWFEKAERHVAMTNINDMTISTVFLGMNHRFGPGEPLLFETMTFDADRNEVDCERSATWEAAEQVHNQAVGKITRDNLPRVPKN